MKPSFIPLNRLLGGLIICLASLCAGSAAAQTDSWPQLRGTDGTSYAANGLIPDQWLPSEYAWQAPLPGAGLGSPVIFNNRVYLLNADPDKSRRSVLAIDLASGKVVWETYFSLQVHQQHGRSSFASSTPYVDETGVYVSFGDPRRVTLAALDHDGKLRWDRDLGTWQSQHGYGTSPVIHHGKLILLNSQQAEQLNPGEEAGESRMMAFDPETGKTLWSTPLTATRACYGIPAVYSTDDGQHQLIGANTGDGLFALDLETGRKLWNTKVFTARCVSSPIIIDDLVLGSAGSGRGGNHLVAVRIPKTNGDAAVDNETTVTEAYRMQKFAPYVPTPALVGQRMYMVDDKGFASCVDGKTGEVLWSQRLGGGFGASPIVVGEKILVISLAGQASVLATGDTFQKLATFPLGDAVQATPAYANGSLILRIGNTICCLRGKQL